MNNCKSKLAHVTDKKISVKLKYGYAMDDFLRFFNCTEEEFYTFLQKNFAKPALKRILSEIEKNSKRKNNNKKSSSKSNCTYNDEKLTVPAFDTSLEKQLSETQLPLSAPSVNEEEKLQHLKDDEKILRNELISNETARKNLNTKRRALFKKLESQHSLLLQLRKTIEQRKKEVEEISDELISLSDKISSVNASISTGRKNLLSIQNHIKELEKISVFIYENGEIDTDNFVIDIPETWNDVFENILRNKVVKNLYIKQIKQLAKLIVLTSILNAKSLEYELIFESEDSQKAFYDLDKAMS